MSNFIFKPNIPRGVTKKGLELGLDANVTEMLQKAMDEATEPILQPLSDTEKQTNIYDAGKYKSVPYTILESVEKQYKGFAVMNFAKRMLYFETRPYLLPKSAFEELRRKIDAVLKSQNVLRKKYKSEDFRKSILN